MGSLRACQPLCQCTVHADADGDADPDTDVDEIVKEMHARQPHAVVAVDDDGAFVGYFSPNDYREALVG